MGEELDIQKSLEEHYARNRIQEFPFFSIGRQGGRTAVPLSGVQLIIKSDK